MTIPLITDNNYSSYLHPHILAPPKKKAPGLGSLPIPGGVLDKTAGYTYTPSPAGAIDATSSPDAQTLISGSPEYTQAQSNLRDAITQRSGLRGLTVRQLVARYGAGPNLSRLSPSMLNGYDASTDIDPATLDLANANTAAGTSTLGQEAYTHNQNLANLRASLASKGILDSGQDPLLESEEGRRYAGALDTDQGNLLDAILKAQQDYLSGVDPFRTDVTNAAGTAANRLSQTNAFDPVTVHATLDHGFTDGSGGAVYADPNKNYWDANGNPVGKTSLKPVGGPTPPPAPQSSIPPIGGNARPFTPA